MEELSLRSFHRHLPSASLSSNLGISLITFLLPQNSLIQRPSCSSFLQLDLLQNKPVVHPNSPLIHSSSAQSWAGIPLGFDNTTIRIPTWVLILQELSHYRTIQDGHGYADGGCFPQ